MGCNECLGSAVGALFDEAAVSCQARHDDGPCLDFCCGQPPRHPPHPPHAQARTMKKKREGPLPGSAGLALLLFLLLLLASCHQVAHAFFHARHPWQQHHRMRRQQGSPPSFWGQQPMLGHPATPHVVRMAAATTSVDRYVSSWVRTLASPECQLIPPSVTNQTTGCSTRTRAAQAADVRLLLPARTASAVAGTTRNAFVAASHPQAPLTAPTPHPTQKK